VAVEKGTKAVISANFSVYGEPIFNNLGANFAAEIPPKEFFNSHRRFHSEPLQGGVVSVMAMFQQLANAVLILAKELEVAVAHPQQPRLGRIERD
jgi:hypothetical protein